MLISILISILYAFGFVCVIFMFVNKNKSRQIERDVGHAKSIGFRNEEKIIDLQKLTNNNTKEIEVLKDQQRQNEEFQDFVVEQRKKSEKDVELFKEMFLSNRADFEEMRKDFSILRDSHNNLQAQNLSIQKSLDLLSSNIRENTIAVTDSNAKVNILLKFVEFQMNSDDSK